MASSTSFTDLAGADAERAFGLAGSLLAAGEAHRAKAQLELAVALFDASGRAREGAKARRALAHALRRLGDPSARAVLEDAGTMFEGLGDEDAVVAIDRELRELEAEVEESPRSFHARSSAPPPVR